MRQFLLTLGMGDRGGPRGGYTAIRKQVEALAACRLTIGMTLEGRVVNVDAKPIKRFDAWLNQDGSQQTLWPGVMELSTDFYDTLTTTPCRSITERYRPSSIRPSRSTSTPGLPTGFAGSTSWPA